MSYAIQNISAVVTTLTFALIVGGLTYATTRGADGELIGAMIWLVAFGFAYWLTVRRARGYRIGRAIGDLVVFEIAVAIGLLVDPELEEMGGILNLVIPAGVGIAVVTGQILAGLSRKPA